MRKLVANAQIKLKRNLDALETLAPLLGDSSRDADALILAAQMDGTILVADQGRTRRVLAQQALARLVAVRARLLGAVLNRDASQRGYDSPVYAEAAAPALTSPARRRLWWRIKPVV